MCINVATVMLQAARGRNKREEGRMLVAAVLRIATGNMPGGMLAASAPLRARMVEFVAGTAKFLTTTTHGTAPAAG